jgi:hypothetical protein
MQKTAVESRKARSRYLSMEIPQKNKVFIKERVHTLSKLGLGQPQHLIHLCVFQCVCTQDILMRVRFVCVPASVCCVYNIHLFS